MPSPCEQHLGKRMSHLFTAETLSSVGVGWGERTQEAADIGGACCSVERAPNPLSFQPAGFLWVFFAYDQVENTNVTE